MAKQVAKRNKNGFLVPVKSKTTKAPKNKSKFDAFKTVSAENKRLSEEVIELRAKLSKAKKDAKKASDNSKFEAKIAKQADELGQASAKIEALEIQVTGLEDKNAELEKELTAALEAATTDKK